MVCKQCSKEFKPKDGSEDGRCPDCRDADSSARPALSDPALSPEERWKGSWPLAELFARIDSAAMLDRKVEKKLTMLKVAIAILVIAAIIALFTESWILLPVFALLLVAAIVLHHRYKKQDLGNEFREFLGPLLRLLKDDIKKDSLVDVDLRLTQPDDKRHWVRKRTYSRPRYNCEDNMYHREFLDLAVRLQDGNMLSLTVRELVVRTTRTRSVGKAKTKSSFKMQVVGLLRLAVNGERYAFQPVPEQAPVPAADGSAVWSGAVQKKDGKKGPVLSTLYRLKIKAKNTSDLTMPDPLHAADQLVRLYRNLAPKTALQGGN